MRAALAATLLSERRYAEAEPHLRVAVRLAPERFEHHNNLANALLNTGRLDEAAAEAATAEGLGPREISAAETMALIQFRRGNYRGALGEFERAVGLGADPVPVATALNDMGASIASRGHPGEAEGLFRKAVELNPGLVQARRNLALAVQDQGRREADR